MFKFQAAGLFILFGGTLSLFIEHDNDSVNHIENKLRIYLHIECKQWLQLARTRTILISFIIFLFPLRIFYLC